MNKSKVINIVYWISTGLFSLGLFFAGYGYFTDPAMTEAFNHLGFPSYFRFELGTAKILGAIALLVPFVPPTLKGFAYAGSTITVVSAFIAHLAMGDSAQHTLAPVFMGVILLISYVTYRRRV